LNEERLLRRRGFPDDSTWMKRAPGRLCCRGTFREYRDSDFRGSTFIYGEVHAVLDEQQQF
jgi:hypothetical protein